MFQIRSPMLFTVGNAKWKYLQDWWYSVSDRFPETYLEFAIGARHLARITVEGPLEGVQRLGGEVEDLIRWLVSHMEGGCT